jgi:hypothetical protein
VALQGVEQGFVGTVQAAGHVLPQVVIFMGFHPSPQAFLGKVGNVLPRL